THVIDGDHRLVGEGSGQLDLFVGEWQRGAALKHHNPDRTAFTEKWNAEHGAYTANYCRLLHLKFWICQDIGSMHGPAFEHNAAGDRATARWNEILSPMLFQFRGIAVACNKPILIAALGSYRCQVGFTQPGRRFNKCIEHGLQIEGRAADNLEHIGGGCLLLERFTQLIKQTRVFDSDDGLRSE